MPPSAFCLSIHNCKLLNRYLLTLQLMSLPTQLAFLNSCARSACFFFWVSFTRSFKLTLELATQACHWLVKLYGNLTYVRMWPVAIALNYSVKDIRHDVRQIIYTYIYHEKSQLNRLVWGSLTLAPITVFSLHQSHIYLLSDGLPIF